MSSCKTYLSPGVSGVKEGSDYLTYKAITGTRDLIWKAAGEYQVCAGESQLAEGEGGAASGSLRHRVPRYESPPAAMLPGGTAGEKGSINGKDAYEEKKETLWTS